MSLVFHIVSFCLFLVLSLWLLRLSRERKFFFRLMQLPLTQSETQVYIDWPSAFLKQFARSFAIPHTIACKNLGQPHKIAVKKFMELYLQFGICEITTNELPKSPLQVQLKLCKRPSQQPQLGDLSKQFAEVLGDKVHVTVQI